MGNARIITLTGTSRIPGADPEIYARLANWSQEVYIPEFMKIQGRMGWDLYNILRESPEYPARMSLGYVENLEILEKGREDPNYAFLTQDIDAWRKRNVSGYLWSAAYELVRGFRNHPVLSIQDEDARPENFSLMHMEAYRISAAEADLYRKWFDDYAVNIFIPLFLKLPGVRGYDFFRDTGVRINQYARETKYPVYLSVVYFEDIKSFEQFEKSHELERFRKNLMQVFPPLGPNIKWYVQYQLIKSWRG
jgi:hypothetical protein